MAIEPPPRIVDKFVNIWRDWLYFFWEFVDSHTGGSSPTPPATGLSWNAHGNTADGGAISGADSDPLNIQNSSFFISGSGGHAADMEGYAGKAFYYISDKGSLRAGDYLINQLNDSNIGTGSIGLGQRTEPRSSNGIAIGQIVEVEGNQSMAIAASGAKVIAWTPGLNAAIGNFCNIFEESAVSTTPGGTGWLTNNTVVGNSSSIKKSFGAGFIFIDNNVCIGLNAEIRDCSSSLDVGLNTKVTASNAAIIGIGNSDSDKFTNDIASSMMIGVGLGAVDTATLTLRNARLGINQEDPISTLDVGGSVGFQYTNLTATDGTTYTITGDEYTFRVDVSGFTTTTDIYTIQLPTISSTAIDRRIYYFKVTDIDEIQGKHGTVSIQPEASQYIEDFGTLNQNEGHRLAAGVPLGLKVGISITIIANNTDKTWWVI